MVLKTLKELKEKKIMLWCGFPIRALKETNANYK